MNLLFSIRGIEAGTDGIKIDACQIVGLKPKKKEKIKKIINVHINFVTTIFSQYSLRIEM